MHTHRSPSPMWRWPVLVLALLLFLAGATAMAARDSTDAPLGTNPFAGSTARHPDWTGRAVRADVSAPLRNVVPRAPSASSRAEGPENPQAPPITAGRIGPDPVWQRIFGALAMPTPIMNFEGAPNLWAVFPPDTNGDVGRNNYIQIVNTGFEIFDKTGTSLYGPANNNTLFLGFGGLCETTNNGDPIALYDPMADRWLISQFAIDPTNGSDTHQCYAISTSADPLGSWYRYDFHVSPNLNVFEDYPKVGVWPDAYYQTANQFGGSTPGAAFAFNRIKMLQGDPSAEMVAFNTATFGMLPSDMDGTPPLPGTPNFFLGMGPTSTQLQLYKFHVDFATPGNSTFTGPTLITVPAYNSSICTAGVRGSCIDQPDTAVRLESLSSDLMYRLQYRNFPGDHETLIVNHTVNANGLNPGLAGVRWYEIRNPMTTTVAYQASTYAPDSTHRWMGSAAMDSMGNIAVGFSASSTTVYPSIRYAGRLVTDPLNQLAQGETTLIVGGGSQLRTQGTNDGRWGDYSMLGVDPSDGCTYWYTNEYIQHTTDIGWNTRIGTFRFPNCTGGATPTPVPTATGTPPTDTPTATATPPLCPGGVFVTGSITTTDAVMNGRLSRGNPPPTCGNPRPYPGTISGPMPHYDVYTYTNGLATSSCVTVSLDSRACETTGVFASAYLNSFDPNDLSVNYLADEGISGPQQSFSFEVPAGATYVVVVQEIGTNLGCVTYTLEVNPCASNVTPSPTPLGTATSTPIPSPTICVVSYLTSTITAATMIPATNDIGNHCDDCLTSVDLPFSVPIYGTPYTAVMAGSNGDLEFVGTDPNIYTENCLPVQRTATEYFLSTIFPYYDDLRTDVMTDTHGIYTDTLGTAPDRQFIVRWHTTYFAGDILEANFEVVFTENSPVIRVIYGQLATVADGANAATGIEYDQNDYTAYSCHTDIPEGLEVDYSPVGCEPTPTVTPPPTDTPTATATPPAATGTPQITATPPELTSTPIATETPCPLPFTDVHPTDYFYVPVQYLYCHGVISGYSDNTFRPYNSTTRSQMVKIVVLGFGLPTYIPPGGAYTFADVKPDFPFFDVIETAAHDSIVSGYNCGGPGEPCDPQNRPYFRPYNNVTRGQLSKIDVVAAGWDLLNPPDPSFTDVLPNTAFYTFVETAYCHGIISGYDCGSPGEPCDPQNRPYFRQGNDATRGQIAKIVYLSIMSPPGTCASPATTGTPAAP